MAVRLFGFDVEITFSFWFSAALLGLMLSGGEPIRIVMWTLVLLVSVLVHELGHAIAFRVYKVQSDIRLHFMGGVTVPRVILPLSRPAQVIISLAGPVAGFVLAGVVLLIDMFLPPVAPGIDMLLGAFLWANIVWGIFNLLPVLPLDGGHVVQHILGPKRFRATLIISMTVGALIAIALLSRGSIWGAVILGSAAVQSFLALREGVTPSQPRQERSTPPPENVLAPQTVRALQEARQALADQDLNVAYELAKGVVDGRELAGARPHPKAIAEAVHLLAWVHLARGEADEASRLLTRIERAGQADPALVGAVALARGDVGTARTILEGARAKGDQRKEVFAPLIQVLLKQGEMARACALAMDCFDAISSEDIRTLATMASEAAVHHWAARLREAVFLRDKTPEDAFEAARSFARDGAGDRALDLLRRAVEAGFTDAKRVYTDVDLTRLEGELSLESILPRPS